MSQPRILVVEDEKPMQDFYAGFFDKIHAGEFSWRLAKDGEHALKIISGEIPDAAVLDWTLPRISGITLLKALRAHPKTRTLGILMVTARAGADDTVAALEMGADDYLTKPFDERIFLARLRGLVRRKQGMPAVKRVYQLPGLRWDEERRSLLVSGRQVHLHPKESDLLKIFLERPDIIHPSLYLWDLIWGYESDNWQRTLIGAISSLRKKLGPTWGPRIEPRSNKGYILVSRPAF